ncbi:hypothetical protein H9X81_09445 [Hydrogenoanaerobacterium saccharovorans]|uniref:Lipoprotein n=1 Tax=Hydrogenoanaerobacterium saccharovorans TaxID=474960 RepID=A0ABS2GQX9_9FIRM|nr:hypothetical protein [Hydrogenoanaerobacterium saccharovorans]MBM6923908.1 hypothetical protein [Hydrogenoanaerobacterium saccharovorans]
MKYKSICLFLFLCFVMFSFGFYSCYQTKQQSTIDSINLFEQYINRKCKEMNISRPFYPIGEDDSFFYHSFLMDDWPVTIVFYNYEDRYQMDDPLKASQVEKGLYYTFLPNNSSAASLRIFLMDNYDQYSKTDQICLTFADGTGVSAFRNDDKSITKIDMFTFFLNDSELENEIVIDLYSPEGELLYSFSAVDSYN